MNYEHWLEKGLIVIIIIAAVMLLITLRSETPCLNQRIIPASIEVQAGELKYVGFNTDTTSLNFGKVSPGAIVRRSIKIDFSQATNVTIASFGESSIKKSLSIPFSSPSTPI